MTIPLPNWRDPLSNLIEFGDVNLIATDIDGTLVDATTPHIDGQALGIAKRLPRSARLTVATGRTMRASTPVAEALAIARKTPLVLYNGAVVADRYGRVVAHRSLGGDSIRRLLSLVHQDGARVLLFWFDGMGREALFVAGDAPAPPSLCSAVDTVNEYRRKGELPLELPATTALVYPPPGTSQQSMISVLRSDSALDLTYSGKSVIEVRPTGVNKAVGLLAAAEDLGIAQMNIAALGDGNNDVEMLRWARFSISVPNAVDRATEAARWTTSRCRADALVEVVETVRIGTRLAG